MDETDWDSIRLDHSPALASTVSSHKFVFSPPVYGMVGSPVGSHDGNCNSMHEDCIQRVGAGSWRFSSYTS